MDESCAFVQRGMDAGAKGDQHLLSGRQGSGIAAVLTAAFLWFAAAAPAADATPPVAAPDPLVAISTPSMDQASSFWQMVIEQQLIIRVPARRSPINTFDAERSSEERRVGKECVRTCRSRCSRYQSKKTYLTSTYII